MPDDHSTDEDVQLRAAIDRSARLPVMFFFTSAAAWLAISVVLGLIKSVKLHTPSFLAADCLHFLHYGRSHSAFMTALIYGWAIQAGFGVSIWLMARLCRAEVKNPATLIVAGHFWNLAVLLGVLGIFAGYGTSMEWMAFPKAIWPILLVSYALITIWMVTMFHRRKDEKAYISVWYVLGACIWFPWIFLTANLYIHHFEGAAVMKAATNTWFVGSMTLLVLGPVGLAAAYYFIPKIIGRPIWSSQLAVVGFWGLAAMGGWTGMQKLMGGPLPAYLPAVSGGAMIFLIIPVLTIAVNHHRTTLGNHSHIATSPTMRFVAFGAWAFTAYAILGAFNCFYTLGKFTQLSQSTLAFQLLAVYGFFSMTMFGAIYFIVPRLVGCEWVSGRRINLHFWCSTYGIAALVVLHWWGGYWQGAEYADHSRPLIAAVESGRPWAIGATVAWAFIAVSNIVFLYHLALMVFRLGRKSDTPTLIGGHAHHA